MIKRNDNQIIVYFGDSIGEIATTQQDNIITFQELVVKRPFDWDLSEADINTDVSVSLNFKNIKSVDILIKQLQRVKKELEYPNGLLYYAC